jgi:endonuclease/exonuclease/phosphatase (EEP) superfamily protein YafD
MYLEGDRSWLATFFMFGPRWVCAIPLVALVPLATFANRGMLWLLAVTGVIILGPILGFEVHFAETNGQAALRVMTCNVSQSRFDPARFAELLKRAAPDVVALQEVRGIPPRVVWPRGWHVALYDEYLVASRYPVAMDESLPNPRICGKQLAFRYTIARPGGTVQLFNLHLATPRDGLEAVLDREKGFDTSQLPALETMLAERADETRLVSQWIDRFPGPKIIVGDFNTPVESTIYRRSWSWLDNAFSAAGLGFGFTKITEKEGWSFGARIDHVLYTPPWVCVRSWVDRDIGSDHLPLVAEFE